MDKGCISHAQYLYLKYSILKCFGVYPLRLNFILVLDISLSILAELISLRFSVK